MISAPLKLAPVSQAQKPKPKIEVISSKPAQDESDEDDDENMRMINEYLRREEADEEEDDSDEEYFEQDPGPVQGIQEKMAKQTLNSTKPQTPANVTEKQPLKSAMKQAKPVIEAEADLDMPPLVSISASSGKVVDQLPTIKSSASKSAPSESKPAKKGVSFSDPSPFKPIVEKPMQDDEEEDRFVVNMVSDPLHYPLLNHM